MYDDPIVNFGVKLLSTNQDFFFKLGLSTLLFAFVIRLYYKDTKREKINNQIILLKTSSLGENEKKYYIDKEQKNIKILDGKIISNLNNMLFGIGSILLWCMVLIIFRDFLFQNILNKFKKDPI